MNYADISAQVHRFGDYVAVFLHNGNTVYLQPKDAKTLGEALIAGAEDIINVPKFTHSNLGSKEWRFAGKE